MSKVKRWLPPKYAVHLQRTCHTNSIPTNESFYKHHSYPLCIRLHGSSKHRYHARILDCSKSANLVWGVDVGDGTGEVASIIHIAVGPDQGGIKSEVQDELTESESQPQMI